MSPKEETVVKEVTPVEVPINDMPIYMVFCRHVSKKKIGIDVERIEAIEEGSESENYIHASSGRKYVVSNSFEDIGKLVAQGFAILEKRKKVKSAIQPIETKGN